MVAVLVDIWLFKAFLNPETKRLFAAGVSVSGFYDLDTREFTKETRVTLIPESYVMQNIQEYASLPPAVLQ